MRRLKSAGLAVATLCLCLNPTISAVVSPAIAQVMTTQNSKAEGDRLLEQGTKQLEQKQLQEALESFQKALVIYRKLEDRRQEGQTLKGIGNAYLTLKNYEKALEYQQQALEIARSIKDSDLEAQALLNIGKAYQELKNLAQAIQYAQQALASTRNLQNRSAELESLALLMQLYTTLGPATKVIEYGKPGLKLAQQLRQLNTEAIISAHLSVAYMGTNQTQEALTAAQRFVALADKLDPQVKSVALLTVAIVYVKANRDQEAIDALQSLLTSSKVEGRQLSQAEARKQAEAIVSSLREAAKKGQATNEITSSPSAQPQTETDKLLQDVKDYLKVGESRKAIEMTLKVLEDNGATTNRKLEGQAYNLLARAYLELGQNQDAIKFARKAITIARESKNRELEGFCLVWQAIALSQSSESDEREALGLAHQAMKISREIKNREIEAWANFALASTSEDQQALEFAKKMLEISREIKNREIEAWANSAIAVAYVRVNNSGEAGKAAREALSVAQSINNRMLEGFAHALNGLASGISGNQQTMLDASGKAIAIASELKNDSITLYALVGLARGYITSREYQRVIEPGHQLVEIAQKQKDLKFESTGLTLLINSYLELKNHLKAIESAQQLILVSRKQQRLENEIAGLSLLARSYAGNGQTQLANKSLKEAEMLAQRIEDPKKRVDPLAYIRYAYEIIGNSRKTNELNQQLLALARKQQDPNLMWEVIDYLGMAKFRESGDFKDLGSLYDEYWMLARRSKEYDISKIGNLIFFNLFISDYKKAEEMSKDYLAYARKTGNPNQELGALFGLSITYWLAQDKVKAQELLNTDLVKFSKSKDSGEKSFKSLISFILFYTVEDYQKAVTASEEFISLFRQYSDQKTPPFLISLIADAVQILSAPAYAKANRSQEAIAILNDGVMKLDKWAPLLTVFTKSQENPFNSVKAILFTYMAEVHRQAGETEQAIILYRRALSLPVSPSEGGNSNHMNFQTISYAGLAQIYQQRNSPITAITYYKEAVNRLEKQREITTSDFLTNLLNQTSGQLTNLAKSNLSRFSQSSFLKGFLGDLEGRKNSDIYRQLADVLLSQNRILEAQQILELLKVQEVENFTRSDKGQSVPQLEFAPQEEQISNKSNSLIAFGQRIYECEQKTCVQLKQLLDQRDTLVQQFDSEVQKIEKEFRDRNIRNIDDASLAPKDFLPQAESIVEAQPGTVLIYPLVMENRTWLLWASRGVVVKRQEVPGVGQKQIGETVLKLRQLLQNPNSDMNELKATSKQLYDWLIKPIESELTANDIRNLVFSLDRATRYIPMAALFDGEKFLLERYTVSTVLSAGYTDMSDRLPFAPQNTNVLALGISQARDGFDPLPNVPTELDAIVRQGNNSKTGVYDGQKLLNSAFTFPALRQNLGKQRIVHIATHGKFVPVNPNQSFLLLGDGRLEIPRIRTLQNLRNIDLVVLSACETALGGADQDGVEIAGISSYFLQRGRAKAVMASLWQVNDASTSLLMQQFYKNLANTKQSATKAEALRQAQLRMLRGEITAKDALKRSPEEASVEVRSAGKQPAANFSHPYYWAPFILIGNSL